MSSTGLGSDVQSTSRAGSGSTAVSVSGSDNILNVCERTRTCSTAQGPRAAPMGEDAWTCFST